MKEYVRQNARQRRAGEGGVTYAECDDSLKV